MAVLSLRPNEPFVDIKTGALTSNAYRFLDTLVLALNYIPTGTGTPEGAYVAGVGTIYLRTDGGAGTTLYVKESGTGDTGWVEK